MHRCVWGAAALEVDTPPQTLRRPTTVGLLSRTDCIMLFCNLPVSSQVSWITLYVNLVVRMVGMWQASTPWVNHFVISTAALRVRKWL